MFDLRYPVTPFSRTLLCPSFLEVDYQRWITLCCPKILNLYRILLIILKTSKKVICKKLS